MMAGIMIERRIITGNMRSKMFFFSCLKNALQQVRRIRNGNEAYDMIDIEDLHLTIEGKKILKGIDLHMRPGDTYGLLGPNGAGKSTTIFALLGLRAYENGRVLRAWLEPG
jgi:ABC-type multidrug transport system fused ATPase/permease subunit